MASGAEYKFTLKGAIDNSFNKLKQGVDDVKAKAKEGLNFKISDDFKSKISGISNTLKGATDKLSGFASEVPVVGEALSGLTSTLGPLGIGITALAGGLIAVGTHLVGLTKEFEETRSQFSLFVKDAKALDVVTAKATALKKVYGTSTEELSKASNTLQKEFGIKGPEAMAMLEKAMLATGGKLPLEDINEFANQIKSVGGDAETLLTTMSTSVQQGFMGNKSLDAMKDFGKNIRGGSDATKDLLKSVGKADVMDKVQKGIISQQDGYKEIYKDFDKYTVKQQQELTTLLGGGGEALGARGIQSLAEMNGSLDDLVKNAGEYADYQKEQLDLEEKLAKSQLKSTNLIAPLLKKIEIFTLKIKIGFQEFMNPIVKWIDEVSTEFSALFDGMGSGLSIISGVFSAISFSIGLMFTALKNVFKLWVSIQIATRNFTKFISEVLGNVFEKIFGEGSLNKIKDFFTSFFDWVGAKWNQLTETFTQTFEAINKFLRRDYAGAKDAFGKAGDAGKSLFSSDRKRYGEEEEETDGVSADADATKNGGTKDDDKNLGGDNFSNDVKGASSSVNNVTINLDALQKIHQQILNGAGDVTGVQNQLQQALLQILNDANQVGLA